MIIVLIVPTTYPALWKACGMANIPVPSEPFSKWIRVSAFLKRKSWDNQQAEFVICPLRLLTLLDAPLFDWHTVHNHVSRPMSDEIFLFPTIQCCNALCCLSLTAPLWCHHSQTQCCCDLVCSLFRLISGSFWLKLRIPCNKILLLNVEWMISFRDKTVDSLRSKFKWFREKKHYFCPRLLYLWTISWQLSSIAFIIN